MSIITQLRKIAEGRGTGKGLFYKPWHKLDEFNSSGTCSGYPDPKHGRSIQLLSQGELKAYLALRWIDTVADIREQFPLDIERTTEIARRHGIVHPQKDSEPMVMTTDLLVEMDDGRLYACSCKPCVESLSERAKEKLFVEMTYWHEQAVEWVLIETDKISKTYTDNILEVFRYYNEDKVHDAVSMAKHLVAIKEVLVDLEKQIDWIKIAKELGL